MTCRVHSVTVNACLSKDDLLKELEEMHSSQELGIMEMFHIVGSTVEKIEDACKFTERVLEHGNSVQMLLVKQLITSQLMSLINNTPKLDVSVDIKFNANTDVFKEAAKKTFGSFAKEEMKVFGVDTCWLCVRSC